MLSVAYRSVADQGERAKVQVSTSKGPCVKNGRFSRKSYFWRDL